jgi:hypothetical protein
LELLALVVFNLVFGVLLYFILSVKVTNSVRDYQIVKLKKEIQTHTLNFFKESESYLALMDSRITIFKNLIQKAESMGLDFHNPEANNLQEWKLTSDTKSDDLLKKFTEERNRILTTTDKIETKPTPRILVQKEDLTPKAIPKEDSGMIGEIGKVFRSILGIPDPQYEREEMATKTTGEKLQSRPTKGIDFSVGGNPLLEIEKFLDNSKDELPFKNFLESSGNPYIPNLQDKLTISTKASLAELPESAPKIDKVVHLLKKGFSHSEISEELGLAIPEISLIETIKLERNRRI